jgi:hypothetical protein
MAAATDSTGTIIYIPVQQEDRVVHTSALDILPDGTWLGGT